MTAHSTLHWLLVRAAHQPGNPPKVLGSYFSRKEADTAQAEWGGEVLELEFKVQSHAAGGDELMVFYEWVMTP